VGDVAAFATERWTLRYTAPVLPSRQPHSRSYPNSILTKQFVTRGVRVGKKVRKLYPSFEPPPVTCTYKVSLALGLSARLLPVPYKRVSLLHLLQAVSRRQDLPFREPVSIILRNLPVYIIVLRNNLVRQRSVWTIFWPPRRASTNPKTRLLSLLLSRITLGEWY
jgi:hypothetical protein